MHVINIEVKSELLWLPFKAMVSVQDLVGVVDARLRYALLCSGGEDEHPYML